MVLPARPVPLTLLKALVVVPLLAIVVLLAVSNTPVMAGAASVKSVLTTFVATGPRLPAASATLAVYSQLALLA